MWIEAASVTEIPVGSSKIVSHKRMELALFHTEEGYFCIENFCPHAGGPLGEGCLQGYMVTCPWHSWDFDVRSGRLCHNTEVAVPTYACRVTEEAVGKKLLKA